MLIKIAIIVYLYNVLVRIIVCVRACVCVAYV